MPGSPVMSTRASVGATRSMVGLDPLDRRALADDRREVRLLGIDDRLPHPPVLGLQRAAFERAAHGDEEAVEVGRLLDEVGRAEPGRFDGRLDRAVARDHNDGMPTSASPSASSTSMPVALRHLDVEQDEVVPPALRLLERLVPIDGLLDVVALVFEDVAEGAADAGLVVGDEDRWHGREGRSGERGVPEVRAAGL